MNGELQEPGILPDEYQPLHLKRIASFLGISVKSVRRMIDRGEMPSTKLNGFRVVIRRDFNAYLKRLRGGGDNVSSRI